MVHIIRRNVAGNHLAGNAKAAQHGRCLLYTSVVHRPGFGVLGAKRALGRQEVGAVLYLTLEVWKVRVLNDSAKAAEEGIGFAPGGLCFEKWEESPVYALETSRYVPADGARTARSATGAADDATRSVVLRCV